MSSLARHVSLQRVTCTAIKCLLTGSDDTSTAPFITWRFACQPAMAQPVLVRSYTSRKETPTDPKGPRSSALPPVSAYAFANILHAVDGPQVQSAIEGIAEICAKNRLSLAEEYASHLPPVGEITEASSGTMKPQLLKPGMRRALTSVPEASSGSSEGSRKSKRKNMFGFGGREKVKTGGPRVIKIGSMGRTVSVGGSPAMASIQEGIVPTFEARSRSETAVGPQSPRRRSASAAAISLQQLLGVNLAARG